MQVYEAVNECIIDWCCGNCLGISFEQGEQLAKMVEEKLTTTNRLQDAIALLRRWWSQWNDDDPESVDDHSLNNDTEKFIDMCEQQQSV